MHANPHIHTYLLVIGATDAKHLLVMGATDAKHLLVSSTHVLAGTALLTQHTLQHIATHVPVGTALLKRHTLQHTATHFNTLQHTATHVPIGTALLVTERRIRQKRRALSAIDISKNQFHSHFM